LNNGFPSRTPEPFKAIVRVEDVWKSYDDGAIQVLNGVSLTVDAGESVALCGPSGCGKSTLLHLLGGLDEPDRGSVTVNGLQPASRRDSLQLLRHEVGFVFQLHNLIPDLTLEENCLIPAFAAGTAQEAARTRLELLASRSGLGHRMHQRIQKLSGGERQRTALCRALMNKPRILLADEPTGSLDERTSAQIFELLLELVETEGITLVMATHDRHLARRCDRLVDMRDGKICEPVLSGPAEAR
jgi:lipoprotein-releasing system ATP-binding protein